MEEYEKKLAKRIEEVTGIKVKFERPKPLGELKEAEDEIVK